MNIGFIGLGKLGLPCALAAEDAGHKIFGYDINPNVEEILKTKVLPYREEGAQVLLEKNEINWSSIAEVVSNSDIIFVPIQTPHDPKYEGVTCVIIHSLLLWVQLSRILQIQSLFYLVLMMRMLIT